MDISMYAERLHFLHVLFPRVNDDKTTPLHQAASEGLYDCIKSLLIRNVDTTIKDVRDNTAFDLAKLWGQRKCARVIKTNMWKAEKKGDASNIRMLDG